MNTAILCRCFSGVEFLEYPIGFIQGARPTGFLGRGEEEAGGGEEGGVKGGGGGAKRLRKSMRV